MKTKIKIFLAVLIAIIAIICQECLRRHFDINPQIWVFVVYAMSLAGFYLTIYAFCKELDEEKVIEIMERMKKNKFVRFCTEEYSVEGEQSRFKRVIKNALESRIYIKIDFLIAIFGFCVLIYAFFFFECFWPSKFMGIVCFLVAIKNCIYSISVTTMEKKAYYVAHFCLILLISFWNMLS